MGKETLEEATMRALTEGLINESKTLTWDDIMDNAEGTTFGQKALKVYDTARDNAEQLMQKDGVNIEELESVEDAIEEYTNKNNIKFDESGNILNESKLVERKQSVTEYIISFMDGELHDEYDGEFITEDKAEADALFDELKAQHKLNQVDQYIAKTWVWNMSDYDEDTVEVYFNNGDERYMYEESKLVEEDVDLPEEFYEKICRAYIDTMNLEWVAEDDGNGTVVHGYFENDDYASKNKSKVNNDNFSDIFYGQFTDDYIEAEEPEYYSYQDWEEFYNEYVEDNIKYDLYDLGLDDFYISKEDLDKLGIDYTDLDDDYEELNEVKSLNETVETNEDVIIKTMQDKEYLKLLDVSPLEIIDQVKLAQAQFDELDNMVKTSGKSFAELYGILGGWNLQQADKYQEDENRFDVRYESLLVTIKVIDGNVSVVPENVAVYPENISERDVEPLFELDFNKPINYTKIENTYNSTKKTESKYPKKIKTSDGYVLTKVNDGLPENAYIPEYMNDTGDVTLVPDVDKYEVIEEAKSNEYALNVKNKTTDEFMYQVDCYPTYEDAKAEADKLNLNDNETYYIVAIDYGEDGNEIGISKIEESGNDKAIWEKVEKIVDNAENELYPDSNNDYEYDAHIVFNIYRDGEFEDIYVVHTYLDGEQQEEVETEDVHIEDLDRTLVDIVKKLQAKSNKNESKVMNNNDFKNLLDNGNVIEVGGKKTFTPTKFYVTPDNKVYYNNKEISFGWNEHPSMNYDELLDHLDKMQNEGFTIEVVDTKPPVIKESKVEEEVTEEDGSDCYSAIRHYIPKGSISNLDESVDTKIAKVEESKSSKFNKKEIKEEVTTSIYNAYNDLDELDLENTDIDEYVIEDWIEENLDIAYDKYEAKCKDSEELITEILNAFWEYVAGNDILDESKDITLDNVEDIYNNLSANLKNYLENTDNVPTKEIDGTLWFDITADEKAQLEKFIDYMDSIPEDIWRAWDEKTKLDMSSYVNNAERLCRNCTLKLESQEVKTEAEDDWEEKSFDTVSDMYNYIRANNIKVMERQNRDGKIVLRYPKIAGLQEGKSLKVEDLSDDMTEDDIANIKKAIEELKTAKFIEFTDVYRNNNLPTQVVNYCEMTMEDDNLNSVDGNGDYTVNADQMRNALIDTLKWFLPKELKTEAVEKEGPTYNKLCDEIQFQAEENNIDITEEQVKKVADKICYEDKYFFSNSLPEDEEDWSDMNTYILQSIKAVLGLQEDYKSLDNQLDKLIAKDATDKELNDFLEKASNDDTITNNEYTELVKKAQDIRRINEGKSIKVESKLSDDIQNDPEYREYVVSLLKDGAIDDPEYVNGLSTEEFNDLVTNTWMKDIDVINSYIDAKNLNEGKSIKVESKYDTMAFAQLLPMSFTDMVDNDIYDTASEIFDDGGTNEDVVDYYIDRFKGYIADDEEALEEFNEDLAKEYVEYKMNTNLTEKKVTENVDDTNIENIKDILVKSGISNERTLDLMSKDVLRTLKSNYADDCSADGIYYGVAITDAIQKVIERITGTKPKMTFNEGKSIKVEDFVLDDDRTRFINKMINQDKNSIEDFLGYDISDNLYNDKQRLRLAIAEIYDQMPEEKLSKFTEGKLTEKFQSLDNLTRINEVYLEIADGNSVVDVINKLRNNGLSSMTYDIEARGDKNVKVIRTWFKEVEDTLADITTGKLSREEYSDKYNDIYASQDTNKVIGWNYLDKLGKRYDGKYYEIVEDTYEYPNGLILIVYDYDTNGEDVPENLDNVPEIDHICINLDDIEGSISDKGLDDLNNVLNEGKSIKVEATDYISKYDELDSLLNLHAGTEIDKQSLFNYFNDDNQMNNEFNNDLYVEWLDEMRENHFDELYAYLIELDKELDAELDDLYEGKPLKCESTNKEVITITDGTNSTELDYNSLDFGIGDYFYNGNETGAQIGFYWNEYKDMTYVNGLYLTVYVGDESNDDLETLDKTLRNLTPNEPYKVTLSDEDYKTFLDWKAMCDKTEFTYWNNLFEDKALDENATDDRFNSTIESWERLGYKLYKQESTITVLINDSKDMPIAIAFNGKASKPIWHYKFSNMDDLDSYVNKSIENAKAREQSKADRKAQRKLTSEHDIKIGDIFYTSWGYDQTNTEFYEVVNVRGSRIDLKEIGYTVDYEKASYGRKDITPVPHKFVNDEVHTVSARADGTVTDLDGKDFLNLYKYSGGSHEVTATGWGH